MSQLPYQQTVFDISAYHIHQLPDDVGAEVAFVGRSNAGKSSALNTLTQQRKLAHISKTPGRTQCINVFNIENTAQRLIDLPGYGFAKVDVKQKAQWGELIQTYLQGRASLRGLVLLMDIRHPMKPMDLQMIAFACNTELPVHILLSKADKLKRGQQHKTLQQVRNACQDYAPWVSVQLFSALKKSGVESLEATLDKWLMDESSSSEPSLPTL